MKSSRKQLWLSTLLSSIFLIGLLSSFSLSEIDDDGILVVGIENLDPYNYGDISKAFRDHAQVSLKEACVPAKLLVFEVNDPENVTEQTAYNTIKILVESTVDAEGIELTDQDYESFRQACLGARIGQ